MFERRNILLNKTEIENINKAKIAIFGLGGVGGYCFLALVRMGFKNFFLCDGDKFQESNLNRQVLSKIDNIGRYKVDVAKDEALLINKSLNIEIFNEFLNDNNIDKIDIKDYYIIDMIDDVNAKVLLAKYAIKNNNKIISMMGAGNRIKANFIVSDISKTEYDPLAKKMRYELKKNNINHLKVVYTKDLPIKNDSKDIGSISYIVGKAGLTLAEEVTNDIINS